MRPPPPPPTSVPPGPRFEPLPLWEEALVATMLVVFAAFALGLLIAIIVALPFGWAIVAAPFALYGVVYGIMRWSGLRILE